MDGDTTRQAAFADILNDENEQAQRLLDLLQREYRLLQSAPSAELETLLSEKKTLLERVERSVAAHHRFMQQQGLSADRRGTESFLESCADNAELTARWLGYVELLTACRKQNEINGGAVALNQRQVSQALEILLGMSDGNKTYGRSGESRPTSPSKSLGKA